MDFGIDVASFNTITDWTQVRTADSWAWSKATQGSGYTNPLFASQMASGRHAGVVMGAYHFPDPRISVQTQVAYFVAVAKASGAFSDGAFAPMLDMENSPADGITWSAGGANSFISAFRDALRAATGVRQLVVYGSEFWYSSGFLQPGQWVDSGVFLCGAQYSGEPGVLGWSHPRLAVHQYTDSAPTPGATAPTDRSVILAPFTLSQLTVGGAMSSAARSSQEDDMLIECDALNLQGVLSGGILTGLDADSANANDRTTWPRLYVTATVWNDMVAKSTALEQLAAKLDAETAAIDALPAAIAKALPPGSGGPALTDAQVIADVQAGVEGLHGNTTFGA